MLPNRGDDVAVRVAEIDGTMIGSIWAGPSLVDTDEEAPRQRQLYAIYVGAAHHGTYVDQTLIDEVLRPPLAR